MAKSAAKVTAGKGTGARRRFKGKTVLPNGMPRSTMGNARIPGKNNLRGARGFCKPSVGFSKSPKFECGGGGRSFSEVGKKQGTGLWVPPPTQREHRKGFYRPAQVINV